MDPFITGLISAFSYSTAYHFIPKKLTGWKRQIISFIVALVVCIIVQFIIEYFTNKSR